MPIAPAEQPVDEQEPGMPEAPRDLRGAGRQLWDSIRDAGYVLRPDELAVLEQACRQRNLEAILQARCDEIEREVAETRDISAMYSRGAAGQVTMDPVFNELARHRSLAAKLLAQLKLPDPTPPERVGDEATKAEARQTVSEAAAANSRRRWDAG